MAQQTAVEWLVEQIKNDQNQKALTKTEWMRVIEQAKQIEKEQIIEAWDKACEDQDRIGREYYEQTYKNTCTKN